MSAPCSVIYDRFVVVFTDSDTDSKAADQEFAKN